MPLRALTIDFWNTMAVAQANGARRQTQRMEHLLRAARARHPGLTEQAVQAAYDEAVRRFHTSWERDHTTPPTTELVRVLDDLLRLGLDDAAHAELVRIFEEGLLYGAPDMAEGLEEALAWAAARYRLGIISDTMFSPGRVIRQLLERRGVLRYFDAFVFSDEVGFSKPDPRAFAHAARALGVSPAETVHIGDLHRTDVAGACRAGARACLYTGIRQDAPAGPAPDLTLPHWHALPEVLSTVE